MALARYVPADLIRTVPAGQASPQEQSSWGQLAVAICYVAAKSVSTAAAGWALPRSRFFQRKKNKVYFIVAIADTLTCAKHCQSHFSTHASSAYTDL